MRIPKLVGLCGSRREGSANFALLQHAGEQAKLQGADVTILSPLVLDLPLYNDSLPERDALPAPVKTLLQAIESADGLIIASPEYNWSMPAAIKNAIDWLSVVRPQPLAGKTALLLSASPSRRGGLQGLLQLRIPLDHLHMHVFPRMLAVGEIADVWHREEGRFTQDALVQECDALVRDFVAFTAAQNTL